jgi:predicted AlkP superfamily pyrophosphatase or phosphodiesterase
MILVSLDGFGWDLLDKAPTPALDRLAARGVRAEKLVPIFPTKTFPNHYTIVTGLYAEHHGIVANNMYDPVMNARFSLGNREAVADGRWWGGEPIWVTAEQQGLRAAPLFWPGSEAEIEGVRPSFWQAYDGSIPNAELVKQVLGWLDLPAGERPSFITLYFSDVDGAAHRSGPESEATKRAIQAVDNAVALLIAGLRDRGMVDDVNVVVLSDHGMAATSSDRVIFIDDYIDLSTVDVIDWNPVLALRPEAGEEQTVYAALADAHPHLNVYRKQDIPERFHFRDHVRIQPIVGVADEGWSVSSRPFVRARPDRHQGGNHGYDNLAPSMGALFIAAGPAFRDGEVVPPLQNIHLYEMFCAILDLDPAPNDGSLDSVRVLLR